MGKNSKSKKGSSKGGGSHADDDVAATKQEQRLQAVLLADSFVNTFRPLSLDSPKMLCPLNNVKLLDYSMDFLAGAGVEELFVVCVDDAIEEHVTQHLWTTGRTMEVTVVKDTSLTNAGDALRELDKRNLVQSDPFLLMFGDIVTNVNVHQAMRAHKQRHSKDSSAMMTLLLHQCGDSNYASLRSATDDLIIGLDPTQQNRVVVYDNHQDSKLAKIPCSFFANHPQVDLYTGLQDTGVYICSPDVLARFSDEFDYRNIGREFLSNSVAEEEEGLQNRIYAHILEESEYAARVTDFRTYHAITMDLLQRWCYPVVPDNLPSGYEKANRYAVFTKQNHLYKETKALSRSGRTSTVTGPGVLGSSCVVGEHCTIASCVLGHRVKIADGVSVSNSHIWDDVTIHANATIDQAILAQDVVIHEGAVVPRGCVVGRGCVIGKGVVLPEFTRITLQKEKDDEDDDAFSGFSDDDEEDDDDDDDDEEDEDEDDDEGKVSGLGALSAADPALDAQNTDHHVVGEDGLGHVWLPTADYDEEYDEDDDEDGTKLLEYIQGQSLGFELDAFMQKRNERQAEPEDDGLSGAGDDDMGEGLGYADDGAFTFGMDDTGDHSFGGAAATTTAADVVIGRQKGVDVVKELKEICMEFEETSPIENLSIELNSYKFSQNATYSDCTMGAMLCVLHRMQITADMTDSKLIAALKQRLQVWSPLLEKMSVGIPEERAIIYAVERVATKHGTGVSEKLSSGLSLRFILQTMHDEEILSEEAILSWAAERKEESEDSPLGKLFHLKAVQDFLEWLEEESESEDSDDDDGDDDSEED